MGDTRNSRKDESTEEEEVDRGAKDKPYSTQAFTNRDEEVTKSKQGRLQESREESKGGLLEAEKPFQGGRRLTRFKD